MTAEGEAISRRERSEAAKEREADRQRAQADLIRSAVVAILAALAGS